MGKHSAPDVTAPDGFDFSDERMPDIFEELWDDFSDDGKLESKTVDRLKRSVLSFVEGLVLAVLMTVGPEVLNEVQNGNFDVPSLVDVAYSTAVAAFWAYVRGVKK